MSGKQESLAKLVETQKEQLTRYESRLKDLVRAYKSLNKEKEALETSLNALSSNKTQQPGKPSKKGKDGKSSTGGAPEKTETSEDQVATVTAAMQTLLAEKTKIESNYIADRKAMKADLDKTQSELKSVTKQLSEATERLARSQKERDEEARNYTDMLQETQAVLCRERDTASLLRSRLAELESELTECSSADVSSLEVQQNAERWQAIVTEQQQTLADREARTCSLEGHIAELSASLGRHQQQAVADRATIRRLREQLSRLEDELQQRPASVAPSPAAGDVIGVPTSDEVISNERQGLEKDVGILVDKIRAAELDPITLEPLRDLLEDSDTKEWKHEYRQLKEEFEKYKVRVMAARKREAEPAPPAAPPPELDVLRRQTEELRLKLRKTCEERDDLERSLRAHIARLEQSEAELRLQQRAELAALEAAHRLRLDELDQQLCGQRARSAALLEERDAELQTLRRGRTSSQTLLGAEVAAASLAQLGLHQQEGHMLHYVQEAARKDKEISNLRRTKHQLESTMRQLQNKMIEREQMHQDSEESLQTNIRRLELNASREGANLEYIKNIVVRYIVTSDSAQRAHILNAIATTLRFSADELRSVRRAQTASWWPSAETAGAVSKRAHR